MSFVGLLCLLGSGTEAGAQKTWTLEECIAYAHDNNLQVKRQKLESRTSVNNFNRARAQTLPTANGFASYRFNKGRAPDFDTYTYVNRAFQDGNVGIESRLDIFNGLYNYNTIRQNRFNMLASLEDIESLKNEITVQIASAYLQVLLNGELLKIAEDQLEITQQQVERNRRLVEAGNLSRGGLYEIEAQEAREKALATRARNTLSISYLDLMQYMDLESTRIEDFQINKPELSLEDANIPGSLDSTYAEAVGELPVIRSARYNLQSLEKGLSAAQGLRAPNVSLRFLYYTLYSEISSNPLDPDVIYKWQDQLKDKGYQQLTLSLNIPIANGLTVQNRISNAKVNVLDAREKFNVGLVSPVDYNVAKNDLTKAQSDLLSAKYQYIFYTKILDFWAGVPLTL